MVNQPMIEVDFNTIIKNLPEYDIPFPPMESPDHIFAGGPVEIEQGFVLHSADYASEHTLAIAEDVHMTATAEIIEAIAKGNGPEKYTLCLGYSGWNPLQLEEEIAASDWLVVPASITILFDTVPENRFDEAAQKLGLSFANFSGEVGQA